MENIKLYLKIYGERFADLIGRIILGMIGIIIWFVIMKAIVDILTFIVGDYYIPTDTSSIWQ